MSDVEKRQVELVERTIAAFNAADFAALAQSVTPDFTWRPAIGTLESRVYRGFEGMGQYQRDFAESFEGMRFETDDCVTVAPDALVVLGRLHATGQTSGAAVSGERGIVVRFRGERIAWMASYPSGAEAIRVAEEEAERASP